MEKTTHELAHALIVSSLVENDAIFDLTNNLDPLENLGIVRGNSLNERQRELLVNFLIASEIEITESAMQATNPTTVYLLDEETKNTCEKKITDMTDEEIIKAARSRIKNKLGLLQEAFEKTDVPTTHAFFFLNDMLYKNINNYLNAIPNSGFRSRDDIQAIRHEIVNVLMIDLRHLEKLFGNSFGLNRYERKLSEHVENKSMYVGTSVTTRANNSREFHAQLNALIAELAYDVAIMERTNRLLKRTIFVTMSYCAILVAIPFAMPYIMNVLNNIKGEDAFDMIDGGLMNTCPTAKGFLYGNCDAVMHRNIRYFD